MHAEHTEQNLQSHSAIFLPVFGYLIHYSFKLLFSSSCTIYFSFSLTSPTTAQLLWDEEEVLESKKEEVTVEGREEGEVEELDYDESMEDLDLHPTGNIDEGGGNEPRRLSVKSEERPG